MLNKQQLGLYDSVVDETALERTAARFAEREIVLPTFAQLANPSTIPSAITAALAQVGADDPHPLNLWRVHWHNGADRTSRVDVPEYISLPGELTGIDATILIALGNCFPMIRAHKVLAAYACLAPRIVAGGFDPTRDRAIWPSTGNYARGGVAISRIMGCRGVAVMPEGMSRERFEWLEEWIAGPGDVIRTYGTESNVKEIYDACNKLAKDPSNVILNQFSEFSNHLGHYRVTGPALERVYEHLGRARLIAGCIWQRWHVGPWQWRLKHVRWFLEHRTARLRPWARYKYWLTILNVLEASQKADLWRPALAGPWTSAKGIPASKQNARLRAAS